MHITHGHPSSRYESMASPSIPNPAQYYGIGEGVYLQPGGYLHKLMTQQKDFSRDGMLDVPWGRFDVAPTFIKAGEAKDPPHPGVTLAKGLAGLGLGTAAGYVGMKGISHLLGGQLPPAALQWAIPVTSGLAGLAYPYFHQALANKMRQDHLKRQEAKRERKNS